MLTWLGRWNTHQISGMNQKPSWVNSLIYSLLPFALTHRPAISLAVTTWERQPQGSAFWKPGPQMYCHIPISLGSPPLPHSLSLPTASDQMTQNQWAVMPLRVNYERGEKMVVEQLCGITQILRVCLWVSVSVYECVCICACMFWKILSQLM